MIHEIETLTVDPSRSAAFEAAAAAGWWNPAAVTRPQVPCLPDIRGFHIRPSPTDAGRSAT